mmetsp:Transcript_76333/g.153277  ORF Transcript_76333/g.153277 Transcript_76333/m.153277 type:complete len:193 (-) Transcript_76333:55-633(-)
MGTGKRAAKVGGIFSRLSLRPFSAEALDGRDGGTELGADPTQLNAGAAEGARASDDGSVGTEYDPPLVSLRPEATESEGMEEDESAADHPGVAGDVVVVTAFPEAALPPGPSDNHGAQEKSQQPFDMFPSLVPRTPKEEVSPLIVESTAATVDTAEAAPAAAAAAAATTRPTELTRHQLFELPVAAAASLRN